MVATEFLSRDTDRALDLFADAVLHPTFPEAEVRKVLAQRIDASKALQGQSAHARGALYFRAFFYGAAHPYGRRPAATRLSLKRIDRAAIVAYHRAHVRGRET